MTIPPAYWTLIGEITLVFIGALVAVIIVIIRDRKKLREYSVYLKELVKKLKKKIKEQEEQDTQERAQVLIRGMIDHVRSEYEAKTEGDISNSLDEGLQSKPSIEQFILITGFQMLSAELMALENSNEPEAAWEKIKNELMPLIQNFLQPVLTQQAEGTAHVSDDMSQQLEDTQKRLANLEQFKQLYFNLQKNMIEKVAEVEQLNQQMAELAEGSENAESIMMVIEKNKALYLDMGQLVGMDKEQHHASVVDSMNYSDVLISERKDEINRLKSKIAQQFEEIWSLQNNLSSKGGTPADPKTLQAGVDTFARQLKDAELCIETMDMEIQTLTAEISRLEKELQQVSPHAGSESKSSGLGEKEKDALVARFAQESKEMMNIITGLEDSTQEQSERIKQLEAENARLKAGQT